MPLWNYLKSYVGKKICVDYTGIVKNDLFLKKIQFSAQTTDNCLIKVKHNFSFCSVSVLWWRSAKILLYAVVYLQFFSNNFKPN